MARDVLYDKYGPIFGGNDIDGWFETCYERLLYCCLERRDMFVLTETGTFQGISHYPEDHI